VDGSELTLGWPAKVEPGAFLNGRSKRDVLTRVGARSVAIIVICWCFCLAVIAVMRRHRDAAATIEPLVHQEPAARWLAAGSAIFIAAVAIARSNEPYAFTQDDNLSQFLPVIVRSADALFRGQFPVWNPHQLLGAPTATVGTYMLTYPPTYLSYWIAHRVFGDPYLTLEVFIILHLAAGYFITFWLLRRFGLRPSLAAAGALTFALSAFLLMAGRSQATFVPVAVWLPLLAACVLALEQGAPGWKWALATGAVIGFYFHAGHVQDWGYALLFAAAAGGLLGLGGRIAWSRGLWSIPAFCFGIALSAPLLFLQIVEAGGRHFGNSGTGMSLLGMVIPLGPWVQDLRQPVSQGVGSGQMSYLGTTFA